MSTINIIFLSVTLLTVCPLIIVLFKRKRVKRFIQEGEHTTAKITHVELRRGYKGAKYYWLTVEYKTITGGQLFIACAVVTKKREVDEESPLMYMPGEPTKFSIDYGKHLKWLVPICIGFPVLFIWFWISMMKHTV